MNFSDYFINGSKTFCLITYGCQQNSADSEKIKGMLCQMGYVEVKSKEADVVVINTCCIRENAELKFFGTLGSLKLMKEENPSKIIALCGCMMQQDHIVQKIKQKYRFVDIIFGTHNLHHFPELLMKSLAKKSLLIEILDGSDSIVEDIPIKRDEKFRAWITIMYGCNNFCSYCIVPYVRGRERSRNPEDIIKEIRQVVKAGCKEVTLLGQNVNSYGNDLGIGIDFSDLLKLVNNIEGLERIRFMTSHPKDISDKLIDTMKNCDKICRQLHLPFQAGSNKILKAMNRKYTKEEYLMKIDKIKNAIPNMALSTDVIVGFPGETDEDFKETLEIMEKVRFDQAFMFIYSKRKGTPAEKMENQILPEIQHRNFTALTEVHDRISREINQTYLGRTVEVLVEGPTKTDKDKCAGRTESGKTVNFEVGEQPIAIGDMVQVKITQVRSWSLNGVLEN